MHKLRKRKDVNQPTALTDRSESLIFSSTILLSLTSSCALVWQRIKPGLIEFMEELRAERLKKLKVACMPSRIKALWQWVQEQEPADGVFPSVVNILHCAEVQAVYDVPASVKVTKASYDVLNPWLKEFALQWKEEVNEGLRRVIKSKINLPPSASLDPLTLAIGTIWRCENCQRNIAYPAVLAHRCQPRDNWRQMRGVIYDTLRNAESLQMAMICTTADIVQHIARLFGEDPLQVTAAELDAKTQWIKCALGAKCNRKDGVWHVKQWRTVVSINSTSCSRVSLMRQAH